MTALELYTTPPVMRRSKGRFSYNGTLWQDYANLKGKIELLP